MKYHICTVADKHMGIRRIWHKVHKASLDNLSAVSERATTEVINILDI